MTDLLLLTRIARSRYCLVLPALVAALCTNACGAATWSVAPANSLPLDTSGAALTVAGMSGVAYLGPSPVAGRHRFLAVQDTGAGIITFDAAFDLGGNLVSAEAIGNQALSVALDFEGIARVGNRVFVSDETGPGVREFDPTSGTGLQTLDIPPLFTDNRRNNFGFESLAYDPVSLRLWTATEAALTVDGPIATSAAGTTVRLLELNQSNGTFTPGSQFAYQVEPIHGPENSSTRSGLSELVALPDGTMLALERSLAESFSPPPYRSRVYELDFAAATDVSAAPFDAGLIGEVFTPVGKELLWSGAAGGGFGQNLEGLTVGPRLPNGAWILLGVVDDGGSGDFLSSNTIVSFTATSTFTIPFEPDTGDLDQDFDVDGGDFLAWQRALGGTTLAGVGDGNHDGQVTAADLALWKNQFGTATVTVNSQAVPEPHSLGLVSLYAVVASLAGPLRGPRLQRTPLLLWPA